MTDSTSYHLDTPSPLWDAWKQVVPRDERLCDRLHTYMAAELLEGDHDLDAETREFCREIVQETEGHRC